MVQVAIKQILCQLKKLGTAYYSLASMHNELIERDCSRSMNSRSIFWQKALKTGLRRTLLRGGKSVLIDYAAASFWERMKPLCGVTVVGASLLSRLRALRPRFIMPARRWSIQARLSNPIRRTCSILECIYWTLLKQLGAINFSLSGDWFF